MMSAYISDDIYYLEPSSKFVSVSLVKTKIITDTFLVPILRKKKRKLTRTAFVRIS